MYTSFPRKYEMFLKCEDNFPARSNNIKRKFEIEWQGEFFELTIGLNGIAFLCVFTSP